MNKCDCVYDGCIVKENCPTPSAYGGGGGVARMVFPTNTAALERAAARGAYLLGGATDVLIRDCGVGGDVVRTSLLTAVERRGERVYCECGVRLCSLCTLCAQNGLSGAEELCSVPGTVGGGLVMNCGAFGRELGELVEFVDVCAGGEELRLSGDECAFGYRSSAFKSGTSAYEKYFGKDARPVVTGAMLNFARGDVAAILHAMDGYKTRRRASQPALPSLGSVFKSVDGLSAGYFIDKAGLKGAVHGGAQISPVHANFIVNTGSGTANDYEMLALMAAQQVDKMFGVELQYEVIFI